MPGDGDEPAGRGFLPVDEAARALGVSRLHVRDAAARGALPSRRDNRGALRVDLPDDAGALLARLREAGPPGPGAIDGLFDEVEALTDALAERDARLARAEALIARQDEAIERALAAAEAGGRLGAPAGRALDALGLALSRLDASEAGAARTAALLDRAGAPDGPLSRAVEAAEASARRAEAAEARLSRAEAALERALALGERALATSEGGRRWGLFRRRRGEPR